MAKEMNKKKEEEKELQAALEESESETSEEVKNSSSDSADGKTDSTETDSIDAKDSGLEDASPAEEEKKEVVEGIASFDKGEKSHTTMIIVGVFIAVIVAAVLGQQFGLFGGGGKAVYENPVHGYSYRYPVDLQLVAENNIPPQLAEQNVTNMAQLNLTPGDSLLVSLAEEEGGDNIVYTILELSTRPSYTDFDSYVSALFASLDESKEASGIDYEVSQETIGNGIDSTEYTFEMEVPVDQAGNTRTGVFYDNVFETENGRAYSISFGYPKDVDDAEAYVDIYRDILNSFRGGDMPELNQDEVVVEEVVDDAMESVATSSSEE